MASKQQIQLSPTRMLPLQPVGTDCCWRNIDRQLEPLQPFWDHLQVRCVAECCGIEAFDWTAQAIHRARESSNDASLGRKLLQLRLVVKQLDAQTVESQILNQWLVKQDLITLIEHILDCLIDG